MDREIILNFFTACFHAGRLNGVVIPVAYYGNLFRMRDFEMRAYGRRIILYVWQDKFVNDEWEEINGEIVPLMEYDDDYLERMHRYFMDKYRPDKNLF